MLHPLHFDFHDTQIEGNLQVCLGLEILRTIRLNVFIMRDVRATGRRLFFTRPLSDTSPGS